MRIREMGIVAPRVTRMNRVRNAEFACRVRTEVERGSASIEIDVSRFKDNARAATGFFCDLGIANN